MAGVTRVLAGGRALVMPWLLGASVLADPGAQELPGGAPGEEQDLGGAPRAGVRHGPAGLGRLRTACSRGSGEGLARCQDRAPGSAAAGQARLLLGPCPAAPCVPSREGDGSQPVSTAGLLCCCATNHPKAWAETAPPSVAFSPGGPLHHGHRVRCLVHVWRPGLSWLPSAALQPDAGCLEAAPCSTGHNCHGQPRGRGRLQPAELAEALALGLPSPRHWCLCPFLRLTAFSKHDLLGPRPGGHIHSPELILLSSPFSLCCIAPVLAAKVLKSVEVTVGHEQEEGGRWPHAGTAQVIKALGAKHCVTGVTISFQQWGQRGKPPSGPSGPPGVQHSRGDQGMCVEGRSTRGCDPSAVQWSRSQVPAVTLAELSTPQAGARWVG